MNKIILAMAVIGVSVVTMPAEAAITINFAIKGNISYPGTVTGKLVFGHAGSGVAATSAIVLTSTDPTLPVDTSLNFVTGATTNRFNIDQNYIVTRATFYSSLLVPAGKDYLYINTNGRNNYEQGRSNYDFSSISVAYGNSTFTLDASPAVPEPTTWAMMILGMGTVGFAMRRRKTTIRVSHA